MNSTSPHLKVKLLRQGPKYTGGARFEHDLVSNLASAFKDRDLPVQVELVETTRIYRGLQNLELLRWGYAQSDAQVNLVTARLALPAIWRSRRTGAKTMIILHNYDPEDGKSKMLEWYFDQLFKTLKKADSNCTALIAVSPFFQKYFQDRFPKLPVFHVPNLFETDYYLKYRSTPKTEKQIFLGLYSIKNDLAALQHSAVLLSQAGYRPYFCTQQPEDAGRFSDYDIVHIPFEEYLSRMASSEATLAMPSVLEGWGRVSHESLLVGTPVIGYDKAGQGDLLREGKGYIVHSAEEAAHLIISGKVELRTPESFVKAYDFDQAGRYLEPLVDFILA